MNHLDRLEAQSVYILREAFNRIDKLAMLWSLGKDSNVMVWLAKKAFFGHVPLKANWTTLASFASAIACDPSLLCESTTNTSSAHPTDARQRGKLVASFLIGIRTDTGTFTFVS